MLTVMTPTYNRASILPVVYESLALQTSDDFLWLIIDDGSIDKTEELVQNWISESRVKIEYLKKTNGGKASALNVAIDHLDTPYAVCLDSDDFFYPNAVAQAIEQMDVIAEDGRYCGILALRNKPDGEVMGGRRIPEAYEDITAADLFLRLHLRTELVCFYKTEILKMYRFPEFEGEKFVSPAWMQYEISQKYLFKTSQTSFCQCEYLQDGLTKNKQKVILRNPHGYTCVKLYSFNLSPSIKLRVKHGIMYEYGCLLSKDKDMIKNSSHKILAMLLLPVSVAYYFCRYKKNDQ